MRILEYAPEHFEALARTVGGLHRARSLLHRPFVDHYYAGGPWCRLYLYLDDDGVVLGTLGVEHMPFQAPAGPLTMALGSNFHALRRGVGAALFLKWMAAGPLGLVLGGTTDTHRILRARGWTYLGGLRTYRFNAPYAPRPGERWWSAAAKATLRRCRRTLLSRCGGRLDRGTVGVSVREEHAYTEDLLPGRSSFAVRFVPTVPYLAWRYGLGLSFVRYRLFRILVDGRSVGYVVLDDAPARVTVAHCDGEDAVTLAHGVLLAVLAVARGDTRPRGVVLVCAHPVMQAIYARFGLRAGWKERPLAVGGSGPAPALPGLSSWLVNYDWGDHGLRTPFLDQVGCVT
jgi:hypothetical protein